MKHTFFLFTSFPEIETLNKAINHFQYETDGETIKLPSFTTKIDSGDEYFLAQREGMINFFSSLLNPNHMEVHSNFIMQLAGCIKGYKINFDSQETITPLINSLIEHTKGVIFSPAMEFFTKDWKLIIDSNGNCDLSEYKVQMSAETFDQNIIQTDESETRKARSNEILKNKNITTLETLPTIIDSSQATCRSDDAIAKRIISVAAVAVKGELKNSDVSFNILEKYEISPDDVSEKEYNFLSNKQPEEKEFTNAIWRYESLNILLWAFGYVDELLFPSQIVDVASITEEIRESSNFIEFSTSSDLRDMNEILNELDLTYRLHWACVDARINNKTINNVIESVVYERHYALNWLVNRYNEDWDNVSTPT